MKPIKTEQRDHLMAAARRVRANAHAPYSQFAVGAAVLAEDGTIYAGCNVENASFGLTLCAERVALTSAIAAGKTRFQAIAVVAPGKTAPCGACRQVLAEFCDDLLILIADGESERPAVEFRLRDLLPAAFTFQTGPVG